MPIKALQVTEEQVAFPRLGVLRKGSEKRTMTRNGREVEVVGKDLDHFRFDTDDDAALARFTAVFGQEPKVVRVVLPYPTMNQNFSVWQEAYTAGALLHRCDGERCVRWLDQATGRYHSEPIPCPSLKLAEDDPRRCKPVGRLMVIIPELQRMAHVIVLTHSIHDIMELQRNMLALQHWRGDLRGIVWALQRKPVDISVPRGDKRVRMTKHLLFMEPVAEYAASLLQATTRAALSGGAVAALPDGRHASTSTGEIFESELIDEADTLEGTIIEHDAGDESPSAVEPASPRQIRALQRLAAERDIVGIAEIADRFGVDAYAKLSLDQAGQLLSEWQQRARPPKSAPRGAAPDPAAQLKAEINALFKEINEHQLVLPIEVMAAETDAMTLDELAAFKHDLRQRIDAELAGRNDSP